MKTIFRYRALFRRDPGRSTTRPGRSTGTSGCPPGRTSPSTSTRPSPHPTSPNLRSVNKTGDHGESGVWFWACKCPYMRSWRLVYPPGFSEVEASEATLMRPPNACDAHPRPIVACNLDTRRNMAPGLKNQLSQNLNSTLEKIHECVFDQGF